MKNRTDAEIKDLEGLLLGNFSSNAKINKYSAKALVPPGENYGSLLFSIKLDIQDTLNRISLSIVAKTIPKNEFIRQVFNTPVTFKREIAFYEIIAPALIQFQLEQGADNVISCFPKCYGARINLNSESNVIDDDAVILLENLILSGFSVPDRLTGVDLDTAKFLLRDIAVFHAIPIAIKLLKPNNFKNNILPHLGFLEIFQALTEDNTNSLYNEIIETTKLNKELIPLTHRIRNGIDFSGNYNEYRKFPKEPFATVKHGDFWLNNTLLKFHGGRPAESKLIDFQTTEYGSPADDVVFFLYSSVQTKIWKHHFDELIQCYYDKFIDTLKHLKCDVDPFTYELFMKEIENSAKAQFSWILVRQRFIFGKGQSSTDLTEYNASHFDVNDGYETRIADVILEFLQKQWI